MSRTHEATGGAGQDLVERGFHTFERARVVAALTELDEIAREYDPLTRKIDAIYPRQDLSTARSRRVTEVTRYRVMSLAGHTPAQPPQNPRRSRILRPPASGGRHNIASDFSHSRPPERYSATPTSVHGRYRTLSGSWDIPDHTPRAALRLPWAMGSNPVGVAGNRIFHGIPRREPPDPASYDEACEHLRALMVTELRRRSLWTAPPEHVGVSGGSWHEPGEYAVRIDGVGLGEGPVPLEEWYRLVVEP